MNKFWTFNKVNIRFATPDDVDTVLFFIKQLAVYEKMIDEVVADKEAIHRSLFVDKVAEVLLLEVANKPVGFAVFFHTFSTFLGHANMYLEDIFIEEKSRHQGYGNLLFSVLSEIALERGCKRLEWCCLDWNKPSIDFYLKIGAKPLDTWTTFRLENEALSDCAKRKKQ